MRSLQAGYFAVAILLAFAPEAGQSQELLHPRPASPGGVSFPSGLFNCTAEVFNTSSFVDGNGNFTLHNVPLAGRRARVTVFCTDIFGNTVVGRSDLLNFSSGERLSVDQVVFSGQDLVPISLQMQGGETPLVGLGTSRQVTVIDPATQQDLTWAADTEYTSSTGIVAVNDEGLMTAVSSGSALVTVVNAGRVGFITVQVLESALTGISVTPQLVDVQRTPLGDITAQLTVSGLQNDGSFVDLTRFTSGTEYRVNDSEIAEVSADGQVRGLRQGTTQVFINSDNFQSVVDVRVTDGRPRPEAAYDLAGSSGHATTFGSYVLTANGEHGLMVVDTAANPNGGLVANMTFGAAAVHDVDQRMGLAAVAHDYGVSLIDLFNITQPAELQRIKGSRFFSNCCFAWQSARYRLHNGALCLQCGRSIFPGVGWVPKPRVDHKGSSYRRRA